MVNGTGDSMFLRLASRAHNSTSFLLFFLLDHLLAERQVNLEGGFAGGVGDDMNFVALFEAVVLEAFVAGTAAWAKELGLFRHAEGAVLAGVLHNDGERAL